MQDNLPHANIKHVVVVMLENRGFDHVMGSLYANAEALHLVARDGDTRPFIGLTTLSEQQLRLLENPLPAGQQGTLALRRGTRSPKTPAYNPGESFTHIFNQMWGLHDDATWKDRTKRAELLATLSPGNAVPPPMTGYVRDYDAEVYHHTKQRLGADSLAEILETYLPEQLPVLSGLAREFAVSDEWFCSVPSQTNTNRAFSMAGTSRGLVNNSFYDPLASTWNPGLAVFNYSSGGISNADALPASTRTVFEVLQQFGFNWKLFWQDNWPPRDVSLGASYQYVRTMFPLLQNNRFDPNFVQFDAAKPDNALFAALRSGNLPALSWVEPRWGGGARWDTALRQVGNDMHPVSDTTVAEDFIAAIYLALASGPAWNDTLLVITFDENGGTYDHVPPPVAVDTANDRVPLPEPKLGDAEMDSVTRTQFGFDFRQYGVRVPTLLVSRYVAQKTVFRSNTQVPFDHTSLIATILKLANIDPASWLMGTRVANAPTFETVLGQAVNRENPEQALTVASPDNSGAAVSYNIPYLLEYVGDPWVAKPGSKYLAAASLGLKALYYPTLTTDPQKAVKFSFARADGSKTIGPLQNMGLLRLVTSETSWVGLNQICVDPREAYAYYGRDPNYSGIKWQIRIVSSRCSTLQVRTSDLVYFVSQLEPAAYQVLSARTTPDPLQRLLPHPDNPGYLTTRAGEWALWRLRVPG